MIAYSDAVAAALARAPALPAERVATADALGRALAEDVTAPSDLPWRDVSLMDGYAVRAAEASAGATLLVAMTLPPGARPQRALAPGEAARVMTGGPLPDGADAVVMQEHACAEGGRVRVERGAVLGQHVRRAGDEVRAGEVVLARGTEIGPGELALLLALGRAQVWVGARPSVALGTSGDELDEDGPIREGRTIESNTRALAALAARAGAVPRRLGIAPDTPEGVAAILARGRAADVLVTCGGASVGPHDHTLAELARAGAELVFRRVAIKPGRPTALGILEGRPVFALPGNPAAAMICFALFVTPLLRKMQGFAAAQKPTWPLPAAAPIERLPELTHLVRGSLEARLGQLAFVPGPRQGSMQIRSLVGGGALAVVPPGERPVEPGETVEVIAPFM